MRSVVVNGPRHPLEEVGAELGIKGDHGQQPQNSELVLIRQLREVQRHLRTEPAIVARCRRRTAG
jgi:hypothetical protein